MFKIVPLELQTHFAEGTVNAFLVIGETVTLVDTGNPGKESYRQLKNQLHNHGVQLTDIDHIVLTHIHIDHAGAIPFLQEERDIPIYVHEQASGSINTDIQEYERVQQFFNHFLESCGADPERHMIKRPFQEEIWHNVHYVKEGDQLPLGGKKFEVVYVPGHSQCDMSLWNRETGDTFAGDHLLKAFSVNAFIEPPSRGEVNRPQPLLQYRKSMEKISQLPLGMIYPGHGEAFTNHLELIEIRLKEQEKRCDQILSILGDSEKSIFEICSVMYPRLKDRTIFLGLSQIQGHLDLLEQRRLVSHKKQDSIVVYRRERIE